MVDRVLVSLDSSGRADLDLICIPSRATQGMIVQLSPTPFAHEVTA